MAKGKKQIRIVLMDFCRLHVTGLKGALSETFEGDLNERNVIGETSMSFSWMPFKYFYNFELIKI